MLAGMEYGCVLLRSSLAVTELTVKKCPSTSVQSIHLVACLDTVPVMVDLSWSYCVV
jgi:hypothetical protein